MCVWEDIVQAVIGNDPAVTGELLARDECLLATVRMKVKGRQIDPEEIANEVQMQLLTRWDNIRGALIGAASGRTLAARVPLLRQKIKWLILDCLRNQGPIGIPLGRSKDGEGYTIDPPDDEDTTVVEAETAEAFWSRVSKLDSTRSRVLLKFLGIIEGTTHARAKLTEEERRWRPDPALHPNSRNAGEVAGALVQHLVDQNRNLAAPNQWLGQEFQLTTKKPQDLMAKWVERARRDFAETFEGERD